MKNKYIEYILSIFTTIVILLILLVFFYEMNVINMNKPYTLKKSYNSVIPLNLFTTWHTKDLPPKMKASVRRLKLTNPEFNFQIYDEQDCIDFIKKNFKQDVLDAYNKLIPASYKSDLWRYCILYIYGGIYIDIKFRCVNGFKLIALTEQEDWVQANIPVFKEYVCNGILICKPGNKILKKCINKIVYNCKKEYYGKNCLWPTGPGLLGSYFKQNVKDNMNYLHVRIYNIVNTEVILCRRTNRIILSSYTKYRKEQTKTPYSVLWKQRKIYN
jgi:mannosyltransferase OCH1-like enzyme